MNSPEGCECMRAKAYSSSFAIVKQALSFCIKEWHTWMNMWGWLGTSQPGLSLAMPLENLIWIWSQFIPKNSWIKSLVALRERESFGSSAEPSTKASLSKPRISGAKEWAVWLHLNIPHNIECHNWCVHTSVFFVCRFIHSYHVCNNYVTYIVAMWLYFGWLDWLLV